ncbi:MAG: hypothetical protein AABY22_02325, partial [Nanoarchaeota archaeon]
AVKLIANFGLFAAKSLAQVIESQSTQYKIQQAQIRLLEQEPALRLQILKLGNNQNAIENAINQTLIQRAAILNQNAVVQAGLGKSKLLVLSGDTLVRNPKQPRAAVGFIPSLQESIGALKGGYQPGKIKQTNISGFGNVIYNSAEQVKKFPGFIQPAIIPPQSSRAGVNYNKSFTAQHGFSPYQSQGYVPNFANFIKTPFVQGELESVFNYMQKRYPRIMGKMVNEVSVNPNRASEFAAAAFHLSSKDITFSEGFSVNRPTGTLVGTFAHELSHAIDKYRGTRSPVYEEREALANRRAESVFQKFRKQYGFGEQRMLSKLGFSSGFFPNANKGIIPPQGSKAGINYNKSFIQAHGFSPYKADGFVPSYAVFQTGQSKDSVRNILRAYNKGENIDKLWFSVYEDNKLRHFNKSISLRNTSGQGKGYVLGMDIPEIQSRGGDTVIGNFNPARLSTITSVKTGLSEGRTLDFKKFAEKYWGIFGYSGFSPYANKGLIPNYANYIRAFHGTSSSLLPSILNKGILPISQTGLNRRTFPEKNLYEGRENLVFASQTSLPAKGSATQRAFGTKDKEIILSFKIPKDYFQKESITDNYYDTSDKAFLLPQIKPEWIDKKFYFDKKQNKYLNFSSGFLPNKGLIPNFNAVLGYPPLTQAISREKSAGIPLNQIKVGSSLKIASSLNPLGLGVYNTRDEPGGLSQGINRYANMGLDPKRAGIPNYVDFPEDVHFKNFLEKSKKAEEAANRLLKDYADFEKKHGQSVKSFIAGEKPIKQQITSDTSLASVIPSVSNINKLKSNSPKNYYQDIKSPFSDPFERSPGNILLSPQLSEQLETEITKLKQQIKLGTHNQSSLAEATLNLKNQFNLTVESTRKINQRLNASLTVRTNPPIKRTIREQLSGFVSGNQLSFGGLPFGDIGTFGFTGGSAQGEFIGITQQAEIAQRRKILQSRTLKGPLTPGLTPITSNNQLYTSIFGLPSNPLEFTKQEELLQEQKEFRQKLEVEQQKTQRIGTANLSFNRLATSNYLGGSRTDFNNQLKQLLQTQRNQLSPKEFTELRNQVVEFAQQGTKQFITQSFSTKTDQLGFRDVFTSILPNSRFRNLQDEAKRTGQLGVFSQAKQRLQGTALTSSFVLPVLGGVLEQGIGGFAGDTRGGRGVARAAGGLTNIASFTATGFG